MKKVIGLSGVAGSGKDLFFKLLSKRLSVRRFAFADNLKEEVRGFILEQYGIDILDCSRKEKETMREFLVFHGAFKRKRSDGQHWIKMLDKQIKNDLENQYKHAADENFEPCIPVITDVRYQRYDKDEVTWLRGELGGILVHISQWSTPKRIHFAGEKEPLPPANSEEADQDPKLQGLADYKIEWPRVESTNLDTNTLLNSKVDEFVDWYKKVLI